MEYYRSKLQGKPVPSLYDGIKDNGEISDELFSIYMKRQYVSFCQYLEQCLSDVDKEFERAVSMGATPVFAPVTEPWSQRTCYVADPEGNLIEISSFFE